MIHIYVNAFEDDMETGRNEIADMLEVDEIQYSGLRSEEDDDGPFHVIDVADESDAEEAMEVLNGYDGVKASLSREDLD